MRTRILTIVGKQRPHPLALVSQLLNQARGVVSLSKPDVYTQLVTRRTADGIHDSELRALVRSCTQVICASMARSHGAFGLPVGRRAGGHGAP